MQFINGTLPLFSFARARSALYSAESLMGPAIDAVLNLRRPRLPIDDPELFREARAALEDVLRRDVENIAKGIYPIEVLRPENPVTHLKRLPKMLVEGLRIARRRKSHRAHEFSAGAKDLLADLPDYYKRNFHYQGDGYLSEESAELYDHQVDVLFAGSTDAMRRMLIVPLKEKFGHTDGEGLKFLEVGAGTGRATKFIRLAFPKAKIVALDLSAPYLKKAQKNLRAFSRHDFVEGDAAQLPFQDETFDAVYSVFLFHELPKTVREEVIREGLRVLKPGGFYGFIDSLQLGDHPAFDGALKQFPIEFHEPFYRNYIEEPMRGLFARAGLESIKEGKGFFSKMIAATKPEVVPNANRH